MVDFTKPSEINKIWSEAGDKTNPGDAKISQGWLVEAPPRQTFNFLINRQDAALAYLNQKGIPIWDATTEYISGKSYVQASDGKIYRCIQTGTNQNPVAVPTFWVRAFDDFDTSYDKAESDAKYLWRANNLSDLTNAATARTNLDVYSKTEADNRYVNTSGDDAMAGSLAINGGTLSTSAATFNLINTVATTINFAGAATSLTIGALTGTTTIRNATTAITGNATVGGTLSVTSNTTLSGDLAVNGGDITTTAATATVFNTGATTLNIGQAASTISIGAVSGTTTINNALSVGLGATAASGEFVGSTGGSTGQATETSRGTLEIATIAEVNAGTDNTRAVTPLGIAGLGVSTNTANTIVKRDASGNFATGTITAALSGNASTATALQTARTISLTGDVTGSASFNGTANAAITATVGNDSHTHTKATVSSATTADKLLGSDVGAAPHYACRAWVNFNGIGTVAIRGSGNVSSITDRGTGAYTANFTTAMPDANYAALVTTRRSGTVSSGFMNIPATGETNAQYDVNGILLYSMGGDGSNLDADTINLAIFR